MNNLTLQKKVTIGLQLFVIFFLFCTTTAVDQRLEKKNINLSNNGVGYVFAYVGEYANLIKEFGTGETPLISINTKNIKSLFTGE